MSRGGYTHGRPRVPVEACHSLSAWGYFQRAQLWDDPEDDLEFAWDSDNRSRVVMRSVIGGRVYRQEIALVTTPCRFGGERFWFACPGCGRRVGKVYLPCVMYVNNARVSDFLCRHCYPLTYEQRRERDHYWTLLHRAERIAARWLGEITSEWIEKPKGQHRRTFEQRANEYENIIGRSNAGAIASAHRLAARLGVRL